MIFFIILRTIQTFRTHQLHPFTESAENKSIMMTQIEKYANSRNKKEKERALCWLTTFGIQSVVSLKPSEDFLDIIKRHIEGRCDIQQIHLDTREYYHQVHHRSHSGELAHHEEADKVSVRIMELLEQHECGLSAENFSKTHRHMFHGIYHDSGKLRERPASKKEWVLSNSSVLYPSSDLIGDYLDRLFSIERAINYSQLSSSHRLHSYSSFIARLFMINAFHYANTRTAFVYAMQYMLSRGYQFKNDTFYREAWYFRNAMIRACYTNMHQGIYPTTEYMVMFLGNLFHDEDNELRNHRMVIKGE